MSNTKEKIDNIITAVRQQGVLWLKNTNFLSVPMKSSNLIGVAFFFAYCVMFNGCVSTQEGSTTNELRSQVSHPPPGKTTVYLFRQPANQISGLPLEIRIDKAVVGRLEKKTYLCVFLEPGEHEIQTAMIFPGGSSTVLCKSSMKIVDAGKVLYLKLMAEKAKLVAHPEAYTGQRTMTIKLEDFEVSSNNPFAFMEIPEEQGLKFLNSFKLSVVPGSIKP